MPRRKTAGPFRRPHWEIPTATVAALGCGILFAVGHHIFYQSLDGNTASNDVYNILGTNVSVQQLNIAGGTALALLAKTSLVVALTNVFVQLFWQILKNHGSRDITLDSVDTLFDSLNNVFTLFKAWVWWRYPLLFLVVLMSWLIPIASVVTPATLSVAQVAKLQFVQELDLNIDFRNLNYVADMPPGGNQPDGEPVPYFYAGPSEDVKAVVEYVTSQRHFAPIASPYPNASWTLNFPGPALECTDMSTGFQDAVRHNIAQSILDNYNSPSSSCTTWGYLAWTGMSDSTNTTLPFVKAGNGTWKLNSPSLFNGTGAGPGPIATKPEQFYLVTMPDAMSIYQTGSHSLMEVCNTLYSPKPTVSDIESIIFRGTPTMIQCQVQNATYRISFDYTNGVPEISATTSIMHDTALIPIDWVYGPAFFLESGSKFSLPSCSTLNQIGGFLEDDYSCYFNETILSSLSYQAIAEAFFDKMVGTVSGLSDGNTHFYNTSVTNTVFVNANELSFLIKPVPGTQGRTAGSLQAALQASNGTLYAGLVNNNNTENNITAPEPPLIATMQDLFRTSVVSMVSSRRLTPNLASAFAPPPVQVTVRSLHNVYAYSAAKLWTAYGIAIFITVILVAIGLGVIFATRSSYSLSFSTLFRAARGAIISTRIDSGDLDGKDPLPSYLSKATIRLHGDRDAENNSYELLSGGPQAYTRAPNLKGPPNRRPLPKVAGTRTVRTS